MKKISNYLKVILILSGLVLFPGNKGLVAQDLPPTSNIFDTKHNLSISGPGAVKSTTEGRMCIFCHTPHHASREIPYLWNKALSTAEYIPYQSTTMYATVGQPTGASKMCLSCHDGTIALGALISEPFEIPFAGDIRFMPAGPSKIGTDLSDDHPVSFIFDTSLAADNGELNDPSSLPAEVRLDTNGALQCTSCHDPHSNVNGKFLVLPNESSGLCTTCHQKNGWPITSHSLSSAIWNGEGADPWPHTPYSSVTENGCENCHSPHSAEGHVRLLNYAFEEDNCIVCHNGSVASKNIETELTKPYIHPVQDFTGVHDAAEDFTAPVQNHVECVDCHNPHWANNSPSPGAPLVSGINEGVKGINSSGLQIEPAVNQYEICFKCHADNNVISTFPVDRQIFDLNTRLEFNPSNPSFHPVEIEGVNPNVPSLLPPYTESSIIFCTDCHNNDDPAGPGGPHGSLLPFILERNYFMQDYVIFSEERYALCFKCHNWDGSANSLRQNASFKHKKHMENAEASCFTCHDPHGISSTQGNSTNNSHLINFNTTIVKPHPIFGGPVFIDEGTFRGSCTLECHGKKHNNQSYNCPC